MTQVFGRRTETEEEFDVEAYRDAVLREYGIADDAEAGRILPEDCQAILDAFVTVRDGQERTPGSGRVVLRHRGDGRVGVSIEGMVLYHAPLCTDRVDCDGSCDPDTY